MRKQHISILALAGFICLQAAAWFGNKNFTLPAQTTPYDKLWKTVDSCNDKGLTESALKIIEQIYQKAKAENNAGQFVKAILNRSRFSSYKEENAQQKNIEKLQQEVKDAQFPIRPVLQNILASAYWNYYQRNRWQINQRTKLEVKGSDMSTWDISALTNACVKNYLASLQDANKLQQVKLDVYEPIVTKGTVNTQKLRPTLYDFLLFRALDFFKNSEASVTKATNTFAVNNPAYFSPFKDFAALKLPANTDTFNLDYFALKYLQDAENFHLADKEPEALIDADLARLNWLHTNYTGPDKDSLYLKGLATLKNAYTVSPACAEVAWNLASWYNNKGIEAYKPLVNDDFKWHRKKARAIVTEVFKKYPNSYGASLCRTLEDNIINKELTITAEQVNEPDQAFRAQFKYRNVKDIYIKIVKTTFQADNDLHSNNYDKKLLDKYLSLPVTAEYSVALPADEDYNTHTTETKVPELPVGYYVMISSLHADFKKDKNMVGYSSFQVSNIAWQEQRLPNGDLEFFMTHRMNGKPLEKIKAQLWYDKYDYLTRKYKRHAGPLYTSDELGLFMVKTGDMDNYQNFRIEFSGNNDQLSSTQSFYAYKYESSEPNMPRSFFFLDRAIYRPGQTISFKLLHISTKGKENKLLPNTPVTVSFKDVNYREVAKLDLTTNEYGTASGTFTAPQNTLNGQMTISDGYGSASFKVEDYKRPTFELAPTPVEGIYKPNDSVSVSGKAMAYAGQATDGAMVKYRVVRTAQLPYWYWWYRSYYNQSPDMEICNGTTTTNDTGAYFIQFKALPDEKYTEKDNPVFTYHVYTDVTDIAGETHSTSQSVSIGYTDLTLSITGNKDILKMNKASMPRLYMAANNLNYTPLKVKGTLRIFALKVPARTFRSRLWEQSDKQLFSREEYYKLFPNDMYDDELNQYKWERGEKVFEYAFNTADTTGIDITSLKKNASGTYVMEAVCKDKDGREVKDIKYFTLYAEGADEKVPGPEIDWYSDVKTMVEPGEQASFIMASANGNVPYLFQVERDKKISERKFMGASMAIYKMPITEDMRGGFVCHLSMMQNNRLYRHDVYVNVPYSNKELDVTTETFRNKLLPGQSEEWKITVKNRKGEKETAEMLASMYDASLDAFVSHYWSAGIYSGYYSQIYPGYYENTVSTSYALYNNMNEYHYPESKTYNELNLFDAFGGGYYHNRSYGYYRHSKKKDGGADNEKNNYEESFDGAMAPMAKAAEQQEVVADMTTTTGTAKNEDKKVSGLGGKMDEITTVSKNITTSESNPLDGDGKDSRQDVQIRSNFAETAFYYPNLTTNDKGEVVVKFTVPDAVTRWKFMAFAHTKDLKTGQLVKETVTQKLLMVQSHAPRFFRERDKIFFPVKISNTGDTKQTGTVELTLTEALTGKDITAELMKESAVQNFSVEKGRSTSTSWELNIPEGTQAITYKVVAKTGNVSDGEENTAPVLINRMLVTESMPLPVRGQQTKTFFFEKLINQNNHSTTLRNYRLTLEFTSNPAWYAVQSLPYLMEYPYECAEQTFSRFYANTLASYVANSKPAIKKVFNSWKSSSPEAFYSNLQKNQELKALMLEETPWVLDAKDESESKKRVGLLFDLNRMSNELSSARNKLLKMQVSNGGWPWFTGMPDDEYITQHIVCGFGHLDKLGAIKLRSDYPLWSTMQRAVNYCDYRIDEEYDYIKKYYPKYKEENHLSYNAIQYLYARSFYTDVTIPGSAKEAVDYFTRQAKKYWNIQGRYMQAMICLSLYRGGDKQTSADIIKSFRENAIQNEEMGMYFKENYEGYYWYEAPIEAQSLIIEAFAEVAQDIKTADELRIWLLKSKQTQNWKSTKATTEAVYALLLQGTEWLNTEPDVEIKLGNETIKPGKDPDIKVEPGTGYFKKAWSGTEIKPEMGKVIVTKTGKSIGWGALYWQYFEQLDKITSHETNLKMNKKLYLQRNTPTGPILQEVKPGEQQAVGDKIKVRMELRVDRDMQYVHMKDMRASGFEPVNVLSGYRWQDGLGYYQSTRDATTNFFFSNLPKGTYVFEYFLNVSHAGNFSNGITTIQCMYAPEFTSHSEGIRVAVKK